MTRRVAFLRGVNVGGRHLVKMEAVRRLFEDAGFRHVESFKASGNILFESTETQLTRGLPRVRDGLEKMAQGQVALILRTEEQLQRLAAQDPFRGRLSESTVPYATVFESEPRGIPLTRFTSARGDVEVVHWFAGTALSLSRRVGGRFGFPNQVLEDRFGVPATTRNWATILGVLQLWRSGSTRP